MLLRLKLRVSGLSEPSLKVRSFAQSSWKGALIVTHVNADPDAIATALLLKHVLERAGVCNVKVAFPSGPSKLSRKLLRNLGLTFEYMVEPDCETIGSVAVVDTSNYNQVGGFASIINSAETLLVLDHHIPPGDLAEKADFTVILEEPASSLIVYQVIEELKIPLSPVLATLALAGTLFDTKRFIHVSPVALKLTACMLKRGGDYLKALELLEEEIDFSEKVARLKGAIRSSVIRLGEFLVAVSEVSSHEASVARSLITLGADVSIVTCERDDECRLSIRFSRKFCEKNKLHVGRHVVSELAKRIKGSGGGHELAGGFSGRCSSSEVQRESLSIIAQAIGFRSIKYLK